MVETTSLLVDTQGHTDFVNITQEVGGAVVASQLMNGIATVFCPGSTGAITTVEFEEGVLADIRRALDQIAPPNGDYLHHLRWGDDNGHSHVRAALIGPSLTVPFVEGRLSLGTWQQIVLVDCDTRPRARRLVIQVMGE